MRILETWIKSSAHTWTHESYTFPKLNQYKLLTTRIFVASSEPTLHHAPVQHHNSPSLTLTLTLVLFEIYLSQQPKKIFAPLKCSHMHLTKSLCFHDKFAVAIAAAMKANTAENMIEARVEELELSFGPQAMSQETPMDEKAVLAALMDVSKAAFWVGSLQQSFV